MRELIRGGEGPHAGRSGVSPWSEIPLDGRAVVSPGSDLPLNRILYIPFSIFAYPSNIFMVNFVRMGSMLPLVLTIYWLVTSDMRLNSRRHITHENGGGHGGQSRRPPPMHSCQGLTSVVR